ncbi:MAG: nuclear transport factor 2 family protein, partial [Microcoleus sp. SIO2G3]|nr:nuclear transport factor 2 family protein [Microcoleus sp. SIO2G3]
ALWQRFPNATYQTELTNWEAIDNGYVIETRTTIAGVEAASDRQFALLATIDSRQRIQGQAIVEQTILGEQSQLTSGENPPTLTVSLPTTIAPNTDFNFDAVVGEPLGDRLLLGTALEEPVSVEGYTTTPPIDFELLNSGGVFKVGNVSGAGDQWVSAIVVRDDGMTAVSQRLRVTEPNQ